jgi:hypothetical protein
MKHGQPLALASKPWALRNNWRSFSFIVISRSRSTIAASRSAMAFNANARSASIWSGSESAGRSTRPAQHSRVEEALIKIYLGGVSVRGVEGITEAAVGHAGVAVDGAGAQQEDYGTIEARRQRPIEGEHPYVYLDGIVLKHSWADEVRLIAVQAA